MNTELFIARKIHSGTEKGKNISRPIISIAVIGISLGIVVMILAVAIVTGFKNEIREKIIGFGSHVHITNFDSNLSYETIPINKNQDFYNTITKEKGIKHIQVYATKPGIIKTQKEIQGIIVKGVDKDYNWTFFQNHLVEGHLPHIVDSVKTNDIIISQKLADMLELKLEDNVVTYFIDQPPRVRKFRITGIYKTSLEEFDKTFIFADIKHVQKLNGWSKDQISGFEIQISNFDDLEEIGAFLEKKIGSRFDKEGNKLKVQTIKEKEPVLFDWIELFNVNVWVILTLMVLVAGVNMISGLLILILERTNTIGVLKALGSVNWSVQKVFLYNGLFLVGKGLFWGNLLGIMLCLIQHYFGVVSLDPASYYVEVVPVSMHISDLLLLNAGTIVVTFTMLLLPTFIITRISPVKAIRFN
ncbi:MAG: ABC transporter permease [Marinilabiliales bacterium]|nr:MAG: ABC transporter permease [Marinilabiliales bacterium]